MHAVCGPGHSYSTGETARVALLNGTACVSGYRQTLLVGNLICMHSQPRVRHWIDRFLFEMIVITVTAIAHDRGFFLAM